MERAVGSNQSAIADERRAAEIGDRRARQAEGRPGQVQRPPPTEKTATEAKHKATLDALATQLKPGLEALGATVAADGGARAASAFPPRKLIDANGIDVSDAGMAAMKILAGAAKKEGAKVRIRARVVGGAAAQGAAQPVPHRRRDERRARRARDVVAGERGPGARAASRSSATCREGPARARHAARRARAARAGPGRARDRARVAACAAAGAWRVLGARRPSVGGGAPGGGLRLLRRPAHDRAGLSGAALRRRRQQRAAVAAPADAVHGPGRLRHRAARAGAATTAIETCSTSTPRCASTATSAAT